MKKVLLAGIIIALIAGYIGYSQYNKTKDATEDLKVDVTLSAADLVSNYAMDEAQADKDYLGKVLQVEGEILEIETGEFTVVTLKGDDIANVRAQLTPETNIDEYKDLKKITIKGKCSGVLLDVTLNDCIILK